MRIEIMKMCCLPAIAIAVLAFAASPASSAPLPVKKAAITQKTKTYEIDFEYPRTGVKAIDDDILREVNALKSEITDVDDEGRQPNDPPSSGDLSYEIVRNDDTMFSVEFNYSTFTGGAHPNGNTFTYHYLRPDGARVYLPEIVGTKGIALISKLAIKQLSKDIGGPDGLSDPDWIKRGAGNSSGNFTSFVWGTRTLKITFDPYQVAAYAYGPQEVDIPMSALKGVVRTDWRSPQPSFDCTAAKTSVEHALCGDVALARLDRSVAESFARKITWASDDREKAKARADQRAWLAGRDKACGTRTGAGQIGCLKGLYGARLKVLEASP